MQQQNLHGIRILLTGATGSLGTETALALATMGATLLLPVRNPAKASVLKTILLKSVPAADIHFLTLDMAEEASVKALANKLCAEDQPLDALIHNAGVFTKAGLTTSQGTEWHRQVNALSPLLMTKALLPLLEQSENPAVVTVTSLSAFWSKNTDQGIQNPSPTQLYAASKRLLLHQMQTLSEQHPSVRFVYAHPGVSATGLFTGTVHQTAYPPAFLKITVPLMTVLFPSPEKASHTTLEALVNGKNGQLAEPGGLLHIWGKPRLVPLQKRL